MRRIPAILMLVLAFASAVAIADTAPDEAALIAKLELLGAQVERDENIPGRPVVAVTFVRTNRFNSKYLHLLNGFKHLKKIDFGENQLTEDGLKAISSPSLLFTLLAETEETQFESVFAAFREFGDVGLTILKSEVDQDPVTANLPNSDPHREDEALRRANAAVALLRLNQPDKVWPLLRQTPDPRVRNELIHRAAHLNVDASLIISELRRTDDVTIKRALVLILGEYDESSLSQLARADLLPLLQEIYLTEADPGLHSAVEWVLVRWRQLDWLKRTHQELSKDDVHSERLRQIEQAIQQGNAPPQWYLNSQAQTMIVLPGPSQFLMGSPETERLRAHDERPHQRRIDRTFAIGATMVTLDQMHKFDEGHVEQFIDVLDRQGEVPAVNVNWFTGARYCNWLSEQEKLEPCYEIQGKEVSLKENYLSLSGYRFPTEAEYEYSARAGTVTSRYFGQTDRLMPHYAWFQKSHRNRVQSVGLLKPNDLGLFDVLGNVATWCQEAYANFPDGKGIVIDREDPVLQVTIERSRVLRGGSVLSPSPIVRCACRDDLIPGMSTRYVGFRIARTMTNLNRTAN